MRGITNAFKGVDDTSMAYAKVPTISNTNALITVGISIIQSGSQTGNKTYAQTTINEYTIGNTLNLFYHENQKRYANLTGQTYSSYVAKYTITDTQINFNTITVTGLPVGSKLKVWMNPTGVVSGSGTYRYKPITVYATVRADNSVVFDVDQSIVYETPLASPGGTSTQFTAWVEDVISLGNGGGA
jgi:hypothetical protein